MYTKEDYLTSPAPYEELYRHIDDPFTHERQMTIMAEDAAKVGIRAVIQPGGSMRDAEVIAAADEAGIAMVFTGMRHFRH